MKTFFFTIGAAGLFALSAGSTRAETPAFSPRAEINTRLGTERSIGMAELWVPLQQDAAGLVYGDLRLMGDDRDNSEWNFGLGRRWLNKGADSIFGLHGWLDRRRSDRGSVFYQLTGGYEYLSDSGDLRVNAYFPVSGKRIFTTPAAFSTTPYLAGNGIFVDTLGRTVETPMRGLDAEWMVPVRLPFAPAADFRAGAGAFVFSADDVDSMTGARARVAYDVNSDIELGLRFETDNIRGPQGFAEATLRFPFGSKASSRTLGLRGRLDESPERDIDVITGAKTTKSRQVAVVDAETGLAQRIFYVDNLAAGAGEGTLENPYSTLAAANAAADRAGDIIYINSGDGTFNGQDTGATLALDRQMLIGAGSAFVFDNERFDVRRGNNFDGATLRAAGAAPVISNTGGPGVRISANDVTAAGFTVQDAQGNGIAVNDAVGAVIQDVRVETPTANGIAINNADGTVIRNVRVETPAGNGINVQSSVAGDRSIHLSDIVVTGGALGVQVTATAGSWENVTMEDIEASEAAQRGILVNSGAGGHIGTVTMRDITAYDNAQQGVLIRANGGDIDFVDVDGVVAYDNTNAASGNGFQLEASGTTLHRAVLNDIVSYDNRMGVNFLAQGGGTIADVTLTNADLHDNLSHGLWFRLTQASEITMARVSHLSSADNTNDGAYLQVANTSNLGAAFDNSTFTGNNRGFYLADTSTGSVVLDLGGGPFGSEGINRLFGNTARDFRGDLGGATVNAQNNWWGDPAGVQPGQTQLPTGGSLVTVPFLDEDPLAP